MTRIFFRADGSSSMGLGHVYRSCALADMLRGHFECHFIIRNALPELHELISRYCMSVFSLDTDYFEEIEESRHVSDLIRAEDILVLDGYHFTTGYQQIIKNRVGCKMVSIDDIHACTYLSDVVISHIGGLTPANFSANYFTEFYLGPRYALIRKEFLRIDESLGQNKYRDQCLLLFLGGSDPSNDTLAVLQQLPVSQFTDIHVITGAGYRFQDQLKAAVAEEFPNTILHHSIGADAVEALMETCGYAILAPSTVSYEYMSLGGIVFLQLIADNQQAVKDFYLAEGMAEDLSSFRILSAEEQTQMLTAQRRYFDGRSPERLLRIFQSLELARSITCRKVRADDVHRVYAWVNDPLTREMSYQQETIPFESHEAWFLKKALAAPHYYILEINGDPFGQIRFEADENGEYMLSFLLAPEFRGQGLGAKVLAEGMKMLKQDLGDQPAVVTGYVKKSNQSSAMSFERLAFIRSETDLYPESFKYTIVI